MQGSATKEALRNVRFLADRGRSKEAAAARASIPTGTELKERAITKAAKAVETLLFQFGGLSTIERVLASLLKRPLVTEVLPTELKAKLDSSAGEE